MSVKNSQRCLTICCLWVCLSIVVFISELYNNGAFVTSRDVINTQVREWEECYCSKIDFSNWPPKNSCSLHHTTRFSLENTTDTRTVFKVPNIVHYTWFYNGPVAFKFHHMLSILSVQKFIKPNVIYFHTNNPPTGLFWDKVKDLPSMNITFRKPKNDILGTKIHRPMFETSASNVERLKVLAEYGGIYMDLDYIALNSFDPLRVYPCTIGLELPGRICGGLVISAQDSPFLHMWMRSYIEDYRREWAYNTGLVPVKLWKKCPDLVHVETKLLHRPNYYDNELTQLLNSSTWWKWRQNYGVHLWFRKWKSYLLRHHGVMKKPEQDFNSIKSLKNTYGEIARTIL